jgi:hypothetical protein
MMEETSDKCRHTPGACAVDGPDSYCSQACRLADESEDQEERLRCACGHPRCTGEAIELTEAEGLQLAAATLALQ